MSFATGSRVGPYEVLAPLGAGGMGEVYRARDPRLNRDIAIKVLHASVAGDPERLRRFTTEAQAVAALNHPNVLTIHEVGTHEGHPFLATELLEGETLRSRLEAGPIPTSKAVDFARQAASGLAAAHAKGIAHRDIKPENLFITTDGRLKILDFGLAKSTVNAAEAGEAAATRLQSATSAGVVLGTVGYMSPEQVRAHPVDHRTDVFSLGIVLYEMLTGQRPFVGGSAVETMNAILTVDPPELAATGYALPPGLNQVVRHCLEKNPEERFQSARDLSFALQAFSGTASSGAAGAVPSGALTTPSPPLPRASGRRWIGLAVGIVAGGVLGAGIMAGVRPASPALDLSTYKFTPLATDAEPETNPAWSPDGQSLAFAKDSRIFVRSIDSDVATPVTSERVSIIGLFWFPDSARIGFYSAGGLYAISRAGGEPERIQDGQIIAAAISPDGNTLALWKITAAATRTSSLWFASPITAAPKKYELGLTDLEALVPNTLEYSRDGRRLLYAGFRPAPALWMIPIDGGNAGPPQRLFEHATWTAPPQVSWLPDNRTIVIGQDATLWLGDVQNGALTRIVAGVEPMRDPAVSPDGKRIAFVAGQTDYDVVEIPIRAEAVTDLLATGRTEMGAQWMPSGGGMTDIAYLTDRSGSWEIRTRHLADGVERVLIGDRSFAAGGLGTPMSVSPSPDGSRVLFTRFDGKNGSAWIAPVAGGSPVRVGPDNVDVWMAVFSPDGKDVAFVTSERGRARISRFRVGSSEPPHTLLEIPGTNFFGSYIEWSPAGHWIAYQNEEHIAILSADGKSRRDLVKDRALAFAWSRDGRTLYALTEGERPSRDFISIDVTSGKELTRRKLDPKVRPSAPYTPGLRMSLNGDGTRLLVSVERERADLWMLQR